MNENNKNNIPPIKEPLTNDHSISTNNKINEVINRQNNQTPVDPKDKDNKTTSKEDDENKKEQKQYYGKCLVFIVAFVIMYEYFIYVYEVKLKNMKSMLYI